MTNQPIIPPDELATWTPVIVSKGRGKSAQHLLAGWLGPRKDGNRVYAHPDGRAVSVEEVSGLHSAGLLAMVFIHRRSDLAYQAPTPEQYARRYRGG